MVRRSKRAVSIAILLIIMIISASTIVVLNLPPSVVSFKKYYESVKARNLDGITNTTDLFFPSYFSKAQNLQFSFRFGYYFLHYQGKSRFSINLNDSLNSSHRYLRISGDRTEGGEHSFQLQSNRTCWLNVTGSANIIFIDANLSMMYQYHPLSSIEVKHEFHLNQTTTSIWLDNIAIQGQQECSIAFQTKQPIEILILDGDNHILARDSNSIAGHITWTNDANGKCVGSIIVIQTKEPQNIDLSISAKDGPKTYKLPTYPYDPVLTSVILVGVIIICVIIITNVVLYPHISKGNRSKQR